MTTERCVRLGGGSAGDVYRLQPWLNAKGFTPGRRAWDVAANQPLTLLGEWQHLPQLTVVGAPYLYGVVPIRTRMPSKMAAWNGGPRDPSVVQSRVVDSYGFYGESTPILLPYPNRGAWMEDVRAGDLLWMVGDKCFGMALGDRKRPQQEESAGELEVQFYHPLSGKPQRRELVLCHRSGGSITEPKRQVAIPLSVAHKPALPAVAPRNLGLESQLSDLRQELADLTTVVDHCRVAIREITERITK